MQKILMLVGGLVCVIAVAIDRPEQTPPEETQRREVMQAPSIVVGNAATQGKAEPLWPNNWSEASLEAASSGKQILVALQQEPPTKPLLPKYVCVWQTDFENWSQCEPPGFYLSGTIKDGTENLYQRVEYEDLK